MLWNSVSIVEDGQGLSALGLGSVLAVMSIGAQSPVWASSSVLPAVREGDRETL